MKITLLSAFAFAYSTLALPVRTNIPGRIRSLEVTIGHVIQDISSGKPCLEKDYMSGLDQYTLLIDELSGPQTCTSFAPFQPKSEEQAVTALSNSREILLQIASDLQRTDESQAVMDLSPHPKICKAYARYTAVRPYVSSL